MNLIKAKIMAMLILYGPVIATAKESDCGDGYVVTIEGSGMDDGRPFGNSITIRDLSEIKALRLVNKYNTGVVRLNKAVKNTVDGVPQGHKITAIKIFRSYTGMGLRDSKGWVDAYCNTLPFYQQKGIETS